MHYFVIPSLQRYSVYELVIQTQIIVPQIPLKNPRRLGEREWQDKKEIWFPPNNFCI